MNTTDMLCEADQDAALELALRMMQAAGKARPAVMAHAAFMLLQCAAMAGAPDVYVEWRARMEAKRRARKMEKGGLTP